MNRIGRICTIALAILLTIVISFLSACSDQALTKTAKAMNDIAITNGQLEQSIMAAQAQNLISVNDAAAILGICQKIDAGGLATNQIIRGQAKLSPAQRSSILTILRPIVQAVNNGLATGLVPIQDPGLKVKIQAALTTIQIALAGIEIVLGGQTGPTGTLPAATTTTAAINMLPNWHPGWLWRPAPAEVI